MKLDIWQVRLAIAALDDAAEVKRRKGQRAVRSITDEAAGRPYRANSADSTQAFGEHAALEAMARALEAGESLEVGP